MQKRENLQVLPRGKTWESLQVLPRGKTWESLQVLPRGRHEITYKFCHVHCMHSANIIASASAIIIAYEKVAWRPAIAPRFGETPATYLQNDGSLVPRPYPPVTHVKLRNHVTIHIDLWWRTCSPTDHAQDQENAPMSPDPLPTLRMKHYRAKPSARLQAIQPSAAWCCANLGL